MQAIGRLLTYCLLLLAVSALPATAQDRDGTFPRPSPNATVGQTIGVADVTVSYSRPVARGRTLYGDLVPYGEVWRTGANEATTITFSEDVTIEGQPLAAGTYALFTIPGEDTWTIIFNENPAQWGAFSRDPEQDALQVSVTPEAAPHAEMLTIGFDEAGAAEGRAVIHWGEVRVPFRIAADTQAILLSHARRMAPTATDWRVPVRYAGYALREEVALEEAMSWIDHSISLEKTYDNVSLKAMLLAKLGDYEAAVRVGDEALAMGRALERAPRNLDDLASQLATWRGM